MGEKKEEKGRERKEGGRKTGRNEEIYKDNQTSKRVKKTKQPA